MKKDYSEKCDVWSCGVILFILLSGYPPFAGKNNVEIIRKVLNGEFDFNRPEWQHVSEEAKSLINKMLIYSPKKRITAYQALNDPWILEKTAHTKGIYKEQALNTFQNLQNFRVHIYIYIYTHTYIYIYIYIGKPKISRRCAYIYCKPITNEGRREEIERNISSF